jgi:hypothetical protein
MNYSDTHVSRYDGSPAMMVSETEDRITLVNEDGFHWIDDKSDWILIGQETDEDRERWNDLYEENDTYTSGADYYASYINSDSYINYLNG